MSDNMIAVLFVLAAVAALYYSLKWLVGKASEVEATQEHEAQKPARPNWWLDRDGRVVVEDSDEPMGIGA